jgi:hypothetical protein
MFALLYTPPLLLFLHSLPRSASCHLGLGCGRVFGMQAVPNVSTDFFPGHGIAHFPPSTAVELDEPASG